MRGASREALAEASERLDAELASADDAAVTATSAELLSVARLLSEEAGLARALADAGTDSATRLALLGTLFESRVSARSLAVLRAVAGSRWSSARDLVDGVEILGAQAAFEEARRSGSLDEVEDELFRFARNLEASDELRNALTDEMIPVDRRVGIVEDLLGAKASGTTTALVSFVVAAGRARDLPAIISKLVERAAAERQRAVAEVRSAIPLTDDQRDRLAAALANATGKQVEVKVIVDPTVLGGLVATVDDQVIDGSVRTRLDQLKALL
jgi:F-type H+-transporting ATPase subunit delta